MEYESDQVRSVASQVAVVAGPQAPGEVESLQEPLRSFATIAPTEAGRNRGKHGGAHIAARGEIRSADCLDRLTSVPLNEFHQLRVGHARDRIRVQRTGRLGYLFMDSGMQWMLCPSAAGGGSPPCGAADYGLGMAKKGTGKRKKQSEPDEKLTNDEDFKEQFPKAGGKLTKPEEPPPDPRSTDPRRKQR